MSKIYLINVGANTSHEARARGPIFADGSFVYVSFPGSDCGQQYPPEACPFVRDGDTQLTHLDPDWPRLTYGDNCFNRRARALLNVVPGDWLLFWALLWKVEDRKRSVWDSTSRGWYLIGALNVSRILSSGESLTSLPDEFQERAKHNAHVQNEKAVEDRPMIRVFLGNIDLSLRFDHAVDLGIGGEKSLLREVVRAADGRMLEWNSSPKWNSATRACRPILDLNSEKDSGRILTLQSAIKAENSRFSGFV